MERSRSSEHGQELQLSLSRDPFVPKILSSQRDYLASFILKDRHCLFFP